MTDKRFHCKTKHMGITTVLATGVMLLLFSVSCSGDKKEVVVVTYDPETTYSMKTTDVYNLISDSGIVKYRLIADEWYIYDKASEPYWYFPEGFYVEKFDTLFQPEGSVRSDTCYHWDKKSLWKLIGDVEVVNLSGDSIQTPLLFYDQEEGKIYSDKYVRIVRSDGTIITGIGFETTEDMSHYQIYEAAGEFMMNESETSSSDAPGDSTAVAPAQTRSSARRTAHPPHNPINFGARREIPVLDSIPAELLEERERIIENEERVPEELNEIQDLQETEGSEEPEDSEEIVNRVEVSE